MMHCWVMAVFRALPAGPSRPTQGPAKKQLGTALQSGPQQLLAVWHEKPALGRPCITTKLCMVDATAKADAPAVEQA